ncbi:MAG TPA: two-component regulator propeller domain-containing protein, partial [Candidatus Acidoferrum sp.]|nr:two-component regulator propeller domain-containing protein [Candidatus Acidoferrum sp.]
MFYESRKFGKVTDAGKWALPKVSAKCCWSPAIFVRVHVFSLGEGSSGLAVSPLEKCRAASAPKADSANTPRWNFLCLLLFLLAVNSVWAVDSSRHISQYGHTAWRIQDGVLSGAADAVTQTTDGYLWIGTRVGLVRFDGVRFVPWTPPDGNHLPSSSVASLLGARDGSLWIGTDGGLSHWDKQHLTNYLIKTERITSIVEDHNGIVWFTRARG